jgi:DNA excision repair protein ERCC-4
VSPLSLEAFLVRLYREKNTQGFLKAFSDQPEYITSGMSPLKAIMKELHIRKVHIYPRYRLSFSLSFNKMLKGMTGSTSLSNPLSNVEKLTL